MSRATKWKPDKNKVKVVFRLQFHATHISPTGWNNLFISLVPADSGKATAKTNKANVRNGTCKWADPIYETTRLLQDTKTKQFEEKIYKLLVAMGTSRSSLLGEASINLSDYVDALKPTAIALPLQGSDSGAVLHVTVQLLTSKTGFREFEQQREVSDRGFQTNTDNDMGKLSTAGEVAISRTDKVSPKAKFKPEPKELLSFEVESGISEEYAEIADSAAGFDGSSNTSGSLCAEKHENSSTREINTVKITVSPTQSPRTQKGASDHCFLLHGTSDWFHQWGAENSADGGMAMVYEENARLRGALEAADMSIHELRREIIAVQSYADEIGAEAQNLTKKIAIEISADQELVKEVSLLKSECSRFKDDLEWLKNLKTNPSISGKTTVDADQYNLMQNMSLRWLKDLSVVEDKMREVQEKVHLGFNGKDSSLVHTDLEVLFINLQDLKRGIEGSICPLDGLSIGKENSNVGERSSPKTDHGLSDTGLGVELCHPEGVLLPGLLAPGTGSVDATNAMHGEIFKLLRELDESKAEREGLLRKMDQMECYYEALIQELEENQKQILGELQNLRNEHSSCIYTVSSTKAQMEAMHQQMNNELLQLVEERCNLDTRNKELEKRALSSEAALRRARLNYSIAVNQLQKDLEVLSLQVHSMYETNENLIRRAFSEASQPILQGCQEAAENDLAKGSDIDNLIASHSNGMGVKNQLLGSDKLLDDLKRSLALQEELYMKVQDELFEMHVANVHVDVFSVTLYEALVESALGSRLAEVEMREFAKQLELSVRANESLEVKLQSMTDEVCKLKEEKVIFVSRCNDLGLENEKLKANLKSISAEKFALNEKIEIMEFMLADCKSYKSNYEDCNSEKAKLENLLEQVVAEKGNLSNDVTLLQEELMSMKRKVSEKEHLQSIVDFLRERLENLVAYRNEQADGLLSCSERENSNSEFEKFMSIMLQLEECQQKHHDKIDLLLKEKVDLLTERDSAKLSLASAKSEIEVVKQRFQCDIADMVYKINASSTFVEKLQKDLEVVDDRLKISSEAEEKYTGMTQDLLSDFAKMDAGLLELTSKNDDLAAEIMALVRVSNELEQDKLTIDRITHENLSLTELLRNKTNESGMLMLEVDKLKGTVGSLQYELSLQRGIQDRLEADLLNMNTQLKQTYQKLSHLDQEKAELSHLKRQLSDSETEKSSLYHQISNFEKHLKKEEEGASAKLEIELLDMHALVIAADVTCTVVIQQYKGHVEVLLHQREYSNQHLVEVNKQNLDLSSRLNNCLASKEIFSVENAKLLSTLEHIRSESESYVALNKSLEHTNSVIASELEEYKTMIELLETRYTNAQTEHKFDVEELKCLLESCEKENDNLIVSNEELEIRFLVLKALLDEMAAHSNFHDICKEELTMLQKQCFDLTRKLSEQVLKTEEFKNLSIHLKELKDKADAGHLQAREKKEAEGSSVAIQESLRIAFIKEQYETKIQEVRQQLSISKKHGEDMLWKLQDALDELENRKKCEASQSKRNEELLLKITELEAESQSMLSDKREKVMAYEQLKAELDCSVMSLDCCKEEKKQLMASLQEIDNEKSRLADEVELMREQIKNLKAFMTSPKHNENGCHILQEGSSKPSNNLENTGENSVLSRREALEEGISSNSCDDEAKHLSQHATLQIGREVGEFTNMSEVQEALVTKAAKDLSGVAKSPNDNQHKDSVHVALLNDQLKAQGILSSMDRLQKELERMRKENTLLRDEDIDEPDCERLHEEKVHLEEVIKELGNMSSLYNNFSRTGNSVERVLALELELAEALQAKKSSIQFQSSFLKLHSDEAAVFQSFRDINELIKDMLEMKERYSAMDVELKEMHERYSQLSLDFAEVEGERQKLTMTLKNARSSKRLGSRSQSSSLEDSSS